LADPEKFVFDSFALIGYLEDEPFAGWIQDLLLSARRKKCVGFLHAIHLGEVCYITKRVKGHNNAYLAYIRIRKFPLIFIDTIDETLLLKAASLKADFPISYADAFAAAIAGIHEAVLLTGDPEFQVLEEKGLVEVHWLHRRPSRGTPRD
jgi:ribonuclease VapC